MRFMESILHCALNVANTQCTVRQITFYLTLIINAPKSFLPLSRHQNPNVMINISQFLYFENRSDMPIMDRRWSWTARLGIKTWHSFRWNFFSLVPP